MARLPGHEPLILGVFVVRETRRHHRADATEDQFHHFRFNRGERRSESTHSAADINPHGVGQHHILCREHATDRHTEPFMAVGHNGDMLEGIGVVCQVLRLLKSPFLDVIEPEEDGEFFGF